MISSSIVDIVFLSFLDLDGQDIPLWTIRDAIGYIILYMALEVDNCIHVKIYDFHMFNTYTYMY
jgi:hypothetical protein